MDIRDERFLQMLDKCRHSMGREYRGVIIFDNNQKRDDFLRELRRQANRDYVVSVKNGTVTFGRGGDRKITTYVLGLDKNRFLSNSVDDAVTDFTELTDGNLRIIYNAFIENIVKGVDYKYEEEEDLVNFLNEFISSEE